MSVYGSVTGRKMCSAVNGRRPVDILLCTYNYIISTGKIAILQPVYVHTFTPIFFGDSTTTAIVYACIVFFACILHSDYNNIIMIIETTILKLLHHCYNNTPNVT